MRSSRLVIIFVVTFLFSLAIQAQSGRRPVNQPTSATNTPGNSASANGTCAPGLFPGEYEGLPARTPSQTQSSSKSGDPNAEEILKIDTTLVTIPVSVLDRGGKFIPFLTKCDFHVYEDYVKQEVTEFSAVESPFSVVLLLDTSGSTAFRIEDIHEAAIAFVSQLRPADRVMIVSFDSRINVLTDFTNNRESLRRAIESTHNGGSTRLYDAVDIVITEYLSRVQGRKAIVLFTDGVDTSSKRATDRSTVEQVEESDVLVYPIEFDTYEDMRARGGNGGSYPLPGGIRLPDIWGNPRGGSRGRRWPLTSWVVPPQIQIGRGQGEEDYARAARYLSDLATHSGGTLYKAPSLANVSDAFARIAEELRHQYSIGYYSTNTAQDGTFRKVKVRVNQAGGVVKAKEGYRAPGAGGNQNGDNPNRPVMKRRNFEVTN